MRQVFQIITCQAIVDVLLHWWNQCTHTNYQMKKGFLEYRHALGSLTMFSLTASNAIFLFFIGLVEILKLNCMINKS